MVKQDTLQKQMMLKGSQTEYAYWQMKLQGDV